MATDVDVQYFSHLNGLTLGNNWGDLIRLLDTCLVNGLALPSVTSASIDAQGDITLNLYASHNCQLFQIVELTGFNAVSLGSETRQVNGKYRIKGVPAANQLILKGIARTDTNPTAVNLISIGAAKLASLGYEIIFRDAADVKRVYRAKNPTSAHPFIRVDETISDGANSYTSTYAKSAMVGLIENMTHIDDYSDTSKLQLPLDTADFTKNWKITGAGVSAVRGWCKWLYANFTDVGDTLNESGTPVNASRTFTLCGDASTLYLLTASASTSWRKVLFGCGMYDSAIETSIIPNWFLMSLQRATTANASVNWANSAGAMPLMYDGNTSTFLATKHSVAARLANSTVAKPIIPDYFSGRTGLYSANNLSALEIPFVDNEKFLRGSLRHVYYAGNVRAQAITTPVLADNSMYVWDAAYASAQGGLYFYLGEL